MPGIVGLVTRAPRQRAEAELQQMLGLMRHESFYSIRTWSDGDLGLYVGWSARQGSFDDSGPHPNERGDGVLIFSGEEYAAEDATRRLRQRGHRIAGTEPAYIVHLYEDDPAFPAGLNGRFHGIVADRRRRRITVFNDRYGMHRLYWHRA